MAPSMTAFAMAGLMVGMLQAPGVDGHAYLMKPTSRNFYYTPVFQSQWVSQPAT